MQDKEAATKLMTVLNVSAAHPRNIKRTRDPAHDWALISRKARKTALEQDKMKKSQAESSKAQSGKAAAVDGGDVDQSHQEEFTAGQDTGNSEDAFKHHFGVDAPLLKPSVLSAVESRSWTASAAKSTSALGHLLEFLPAVPEDVRDADSSKMGQNINPKLLDKFDTFVKQQPSKDARALSKDLLDYISSYRDLLFTRTELQRHDCMRAAVAAHAMNHITKTRQRILKNNEHLAHAKNEHTSAAASNSTERETRDQGFTRPKVLILLPFRNSALAWLEHLTDLSLASQVENRQRFEEEFSLPAGAVDKLADPAARSKYPADHVATFAGNIDDSFRVGLKLTRTTLKCFAEFYQADVILASPLGLRMSIEKQKKGVDGGAADFLSSIEMLVVDQADVMTMQNWEHVQFVLKYLNMLPKEAHDADFARIKPWYLDGQAKYLRQSIVLSSYDTPEIRSLFTKNMMNVAGKSRTETSQAGVLQHIPRGVRQVFNRFDSGPTPLSEVEARFEHFKNKTLPDLLKSAVASSGNTLIFVPSYFDFLRVQDYMDKMEDLDFEGISEYSSNSDISRARNAFLAGKLPILLMTERFHFFRRYRIRGARNIVFYALPEHSGFYEELMTQPFQQVPGNKYELPDASEVSSQVIFSRLDAMRLERIVGTQAAASMLSADETKFTFT